MKSATESTIALAYGLRDNLHKPTKQSGQKFEGGTHEEEIGRFYWCLSCRIRIPCLALEIPSSMLRVKNYKGIPYVSEGVGVEEREALRLLVTDDNLSMSFAAANKPYLGGAEVFVKNAQDKTILEAASDGPLFFAKLPAGTYKIEVKAMGKTLEQTAHLGAKDSKHLYFVWELPTQQVSRQAMARR